MGFWDKINSGITATADWIGDKANRLSGKSTAHQLEMEDMKKAGLNPVLSSGGSSVGSSAGNPISSTVGGLANILNSSANMIRAFNYDKNKTNDLNSSSAVKLVSTLAKLFG